MDTVHTILKAAKHFSLGTLLSRFSGLFRDMAMAFCFGAAPEVAAFMVAYRFANLLRRLFGEGNLQAGFVPHFEALRKESPQAAFRFYRDTACSLTLMLVSLILVMEGGLWASLRLLSPDWREIAELTMWMAPGLLFICLSTLNSALLQCQKQYFTPAIAPVLFNVSWIAIAFMSSGFTLPEALRYLSIGVSVGFAAQWAATAFKVQKEVRVHLDGKDRLTPHLFSPEWRRLLAPMALGLVGIGAMQINSALDAVFARMADLSGPIYLWYAIRVQQLPLALFGIALSGALLPPLARAIQDKDSSRYNALLTTALRQAASLMIPCTFGLFALGASGLNLLYGRGHFSSADIQETLYCLWAYGLGLIPASFVLLLAAGSYAKKSYGSPAFASLISVGANIALNAFFVFGLHWGAVSIALATSASSVVNCFLLLRNQSTESGLWIYFGKVSLAAAAAAVFSLGCGYWVGDGTSGVFLGDPILFTRNAALQLAQFGVMAGAFCIVFFGLARALRLEEIFSLLSLRAK